MNLFVINTSRSHDDDGGEPDACARPRIVEEGKQKLQMFQRDLHFTLGQVEDGLALLQGSEAPADADRLMVIMTISDSPVEVVETGSLTGGEPSIPFALFEDDESA